jgi:hypothetical protein
MHSRERDSPNSWWNYALHAHCDRMPSMLGVCDRPKPPLLSPRLLSRAQATTPENLNRTSDEDLFSRVEAVLSTVNATDAVRRAVLAPFVTNALALRIYNHVQERVNDGTCELPAQVALALVILDLTNVLPPDDRGKQELIGQYIYKSLFDKCGHLDRKRAITKRGNSAETKARQRKSEDEALMRWPWGGWPAPGTKALVPQVKPRVERGGAGPTGNAALRLVQLENAKLRLLPTDVMRAESKRDQARAVSAVHVAIAREAKRAAKEERSRAETAATMAAREKARAETIAAEAAARVQLADEKRDTVQAIARVTRLELVEKEKAAKAALKAAKEESEKRQQAEAALEQQAATAARLRVAVKQQAVELQQVKGELARVGPKVTLAMVELERERRAHDVALRRLQQEIDESQAAREKAEEREARALRLKAAMARKKRAADDAAAADVGGKRLRRAQTAEEEAAALRAETEELHELLDVLQRPERAALALAAEEASPAAVELAKRIKAGEVALERIESMPTWKPERPITRKRGRGGGHVLPFDYRVAAFEQFTNGELDVHSMNRPAYTARTFSKQACAKGAGHSGCCVAGSSTSRAKDTYGV